MPLTNSTEDPAIRVLTALSEVAFFVSDVKRHADTDKDALGFLPSAVYDEAAQSDNLLVAITQRGEVNAYAGHLLFGGKFPHARIYQTFVLPEFRGKHVGRALVEKLVSMTESFSFLSVSARVAADLPANGFYEAMGFEVAAVRPGGPSRKRILNVRVRQLNTRTLFSLTAADAQELRLMDRLAAGEPVYVIDLNVFWDAVRKRPRSTYAAEVVSAALRQLVQIVVTPEFIRELNRTSRPSPTDPALEFAVQLPILPEPEETKVDVLVNELSRLVFPEKEKNSSLSVQDRSDLVHLAIAVHHGANAFVTSEHAMLRVKGPIYEQFGVEILHVEEFARVLKEAQKLVPSFRALLSSNTIDILELMAGETSVVETFFKAVPAPPEFREDFLASGAFGSNRKRVAVMSDRQIVCLASWDSRAGLHARANVRLIADEEHPAVETVLNCVMWKLCRDATRNGPVLLRLYTPTSHVISKKVAVLHGFRPPEPSDGGGTDVLQKLSIGRPILPLNWAKMRKTAQQCSGLELPETPPNYTTADTDISFVTPGGAMGGLSLPRLESLLSPTLIIPPRKGREHRTNPASVLREAAAGLSTTVARTKPGSCTVFGASVL